MLSMHKAASTELSRGRRSGLLVIPLLIFTALVAMLAFALQKGDPTKLPSALIGKPAPPLNLAPLAGATREDGGPLPGLNHTALSQGRVSVINFWASWCAPCVQEHPLLVAVSQSHPDVALYGVNYKDQVSNARRFLGRYGNPFTAIGVDADGRAAIEWGVYGMPETFVVNGQGMIVYKHVGPLSAQSLETKLVPAIVAARAH